MILPTQKISMMIFSQTEKLCQHQNFPHVPQIAKTYQGTHRQLRGFFSALMLPQENN
jgi:hypothetical protein